jgi:hypothetical protein
LFQTWVHLHNISLVTAGLFTCEVSTEAPRFRTSAVTQSMRVILPPASGTSKLFSTLINI